MSEHSSPGRFLTPDQPATGRAATTTRRTALAGLLALVLIAAGAPAAQAGSFQVECAFSHRLADDPIVKPRQPGAAHAHDFYGAMTTKAHSTYRSMLASRSTCGDRLDTAGYWQPTLSVKGRPRRGTVMAYYSRGGKPTVRPYPRSLMMVAGRADATAPQTTRRVFWRCIGNGSRKRHATVPKCGRNEQLSVNIVFPDCWDGRRLDSPDHKAHVTSARRTKRGMRCPASHPQPLPHLVMQVRWPISPWPGRVTLSSGAAYTMHADFWNTWNQRRLRNLTTRCLNQSRRCGLVTS